MANVETWKNRRKDLTGVKHDYIEVLGFSHSNGKKGYWNVKCVCGVVKQWTARDIRVNQSCGCKKKELIGKGNETHGMSKHPAYWVWRSMIDRCTLDTHQAWANYGARGIRVCDRWFKNFEAFWEDMGPTYKSGLTIERRNVNGDYTPENCMWASYVVQARNKQNTKLIESPWGRITPSEAADKAGIKRTTLYYRIKAGVPESEWFKPVERNRLSITPT